MSTYITNPDIWKRNDEKEIAKFILSEVYKQRTPSTFDIGSALINLNSIFREFQYGRQEDASEALQYLFERVFFEDNELMNMVSFNTKVARICENCNNVRIH